MNKKTIIICIAVLAALAVLVAASVFFLYSGTRETKASSIASDGKTGLLAAVPSDAVMVVEFSDLKTACSFLTDSAGCFRYFSGSSEKSAMQSFLRKAASEGLGSLKSSGAVLSLHYNGSLVPLLAVDAGRAGEADQQVLDFVADAQTAGLSASVVDCSEVADVKSYLHRRNIIFISTSDVQPKSAERHIGKSISVLDSEGFAQCVESSGRGNTVYVSCREIGKFFIGIADRSVYGYADFLKKFSGWTSFSISDSTPGHLLMDVVFCYRDGVEDFANVFRGYEPSKSDAASVLPSYTIFYGSLPLSDVSAYISAYDAFSDGTGRLGKIELTRKQLQKQSGISPVQWASTLDIKEVSAAYFKVGEQVEKILLMKVGNKNLGSVFGEAGASGKDAPMKVCSYVYQGFAESVFGPFFSVGDESCYTYAGGWIIVGSKAAIEEYAAGRALENTLAGYAADAGVQSASFSGKNYFVCCLSVSEDSQALASAFKKSYASVLSGITEGYSYVPVLFSITKDKNEKLTASAEVFRVAVMKTKAPVFERDTTVVVPQGPFRVKNSGTGKMNLFYQQDNMYLCLKDEDTGKGIWGVPFSTPICGCAGTVDYFANGKLQILFASGSKLYLIDRLGRYVNPFPVDLGKEVLVGPGIYDFNGNRRYNVMILHKDNTIEMYNLQGRKPAQWKTITSDQTIKGLPEAIKVAGKTYWVVRTSIQTLIFGFYGGEPLTVFEGDKMIRSDSRITPADGAAVKAVCYDGKTHTIKLQ